MRHLSVVETTTQKYNQKSYKYNKKSMLYGEVLAGICFFLDRLGIHVYMGYGAIIPRYPLVLPLSVVYIYSSE